jgi:electron transfer flavoprotein alpha subunit
LNAFRGVLICAEEVDGKIPAVASELLRTGRTLSDKLGESLHLLLFGEKSGDAAREAIRLGADRVYVPDGFSFSESLAEGSVPFIEEVCRESRPLLILLDQSDWGRDTAPRLAARMDASICLDCIQVEIDPETLKARFTKPVYGGNAVAVWESVGHRPQVVTMRPRSGTPAEADAARQGEIIPVCLPGDAATLRARLLESVKEEIKGLKLEEARVIVTGGGGIGGKDGFALIQALAQVLRGAVGTTRVPSDEGWMPKSLEIGQTGHMVSPDLYIAVGVSGAPQHLAGCAGSKRIVAVNRDPEAHIFREADFGIIGDYREVLPALIDRLKSILSG